MPKVNPQILRWARETAGLTLDEAVRKLKVGDARGVPAVNRLAAWESGEDHPTRAMLVKMAKQYRRPLLVFYMSAPPRKGDRGDDFRTLPAGQTPPDEVLLDALIREIRSRQSMIRAVIEEEEEAEPLPFVGSASRSDGVAKVLGSIKEELRMSLFDFRAKPSPEDAFALLRSVAESIGVFVLLKGDLGSYHTALDLETFRGFVLADEIAPFIVINDRDSRAAWSFSLLHELTHLWLGQTGVSGARAEKDIELFCNDVAGEFLLPREEVANFQIDESVDIEQAEFLIGRFARDRNVSGTMVAYSLFRVGSIPEHTWHLLRDRFRNRWLESRILKRDRQRAKDGGPNYYVVRRHRVGQALIDFTSRMLMAGALTTSKAGYLLGVKARQVQPLIEAP